MELQVGVGLSDSQDDDDFSDSESVLIETVTRITCAFSILGALSIIGSHYVLRCTPGFRRKFRSPSQRLLQHLLLSLSICDLLSSIVYLLPNDSGTMCSVQAVLGIFFPVLSFLYTDALGIVIYFTVVQPEFRSGTAVFSYLRGKFSRSTRFIRISIHVLNVMIALVCAVPIGVLGITGQSSGFSWCWIESSHDNYRLLGGKAIEWISWIVVLFTYITSVRVMYRAVALAREAAETLSSSQIHAPNEAPLSATSSSTFATVTATPPLDTSGGVTTLIVSETTTPDSTRASAASSDRPLPIPESSNERRYRSYSRRLLFIPLVFIILRLPSCGRTLYDFFQSDTKILWLSVLQCIGDAGQGFANGLCFAICKDTDNHFARIWKRWRRQRRRQMYATRNVRLQNMCACCADTREAALLDDRDKMAVDGNKRRVDGEGEHKEKIATGILRGSPLGDSHASELEADDWDPTDSPTESKMAPPRIITDGYGAMASPKRNKKKKEKTKHRWYDPASEEYDNEEGEGVSESDSDFDGEQGEEREPRGKVGSVNGTPDPRSCSPSIDGPQGILDRSDQSTH